MKYYLPTSTLNFVNIIASRSIAPAGCYVDWKLGWNRLVVCEPNNRQDCLFLYDKVPVWKVPTSTRADFPLIIEVDESCLHVTGELDLRITEDNSVHVKVVERPIFLRDGMFRMLFMSSDEMSEMLPRLEGVPEFKGPPSYPMHYCVVLETSQFQTFTWSQNLHEQLDSTVSALTLNLDSARYELGKDERIRGAELGFRTGNWLKTQQNGIMLDTSTNSSDLGWMKDMKPQAKDLLLAVTQLAGRPFPNTTAEKVRQAAEWGKEFLLRGLEDKVIEIVRTHFNQFLRNLQDPMGSPYMLKDENSHLIQAFAAVFYIIDKDYDAVANMIKRGQIKNPGLFLAFYGAARGYTRFPNVLLNRETYEIKVSVEKPKGEKPSATQKGRLVQDTFDYGVQAEDEELLVLLRGAAYLSRLSSRGYTIGTDSRLGAYLLAWARIHDVERPKEIERLAKAFQTDLRSSLYRPGKKPKKEPGPKSLIKKLCNACVFPSKAIADWGMSKAHAKLLKADLELRYCQ